MREGRLKELRDELAAISNPGDWKSTVEPWIAKVLPVLRSAYPDHVEDFNKIAQVPRPAKPPRFAIGDDDNFAETSINAQQKNTKQAKDAQNKILNFIDSLLALPIRPLTTSPSDSGDSSEATPKATNPASRDEIGWILAMLRRFDIAARALRDRPRQDKKQCGYIVVDEYDVQDLLFAMIKPLCNDLEREDPVPKSAGDSGRVDLCSRMLGMIIEVKYAKDDNRARAIARECKERVITYSRWPELRHLVFFVYDPEHRLPDADNFIKDLSSSIFVYDSKKFSINAIVSPWQVGVVPGALALHAGPGRLPAPPDVVDIVNNMSANVSEDVLALALGQPVYDSGYKAVAIPVSISNRSDRPNSIESVQITIAGASYEPAIPPPQLGVEGWQWLPADVRVEPWRKTRGAWFFGRGFSGGSSIQIEGRVLASVRVVPMRGQPIEVQIELAP